MSRIAGVVVHTLPELHEVVGRQLAALPEVEIAAAAEHGYSAVLTAPHARAQEALHGVIREWPGVLEVAVAFQSTEIDDAQAPRDMAPQERAEVSA